jgi:predicted PurR-regulated permease PerM
VALVLLAFFLRETRAVWVPLALSLLIAFLLDPVVRALQRVRVPRVIGAGLVVAALVASAGWAVWALSDDVAGAVRRLPAQLRQLREQVQSSAAGGLLDRLHEAAMEVQRAAGGPSTAPTPAGEAASAAASVVWLGPAALMTLLGQLTVIAFLVYFLLIGATAWRNRLLRVAGDVLSSRRAGADVIDDINWQIQRFVVVLVFTSVVVGVTTWLALLWLGAPSPAFFGLLAGVLNVIPYFGPILMSLLLALTGFVSGGLPMALQLSAVALVITALEGWLMTPPLLGRATRMNTVTVFVSLLFWSWAWGVWGTVLAIPVMAIVKAIADHIERLAWLSHLLGED